MSSLDPELKINGVNIKFQLRNREVYMKINIIIWNDTCRICRFIQQSVSV